MRLTKKKQYHKRKSSFQTLSVLLETKLQTKLHPSKSVKQAPSQKKQSILWRVIHNGMNLKQKEAQSARAECCLCVDSSWYKTKFITEHL